MMKRTGFLLSILLVFMLSTKALSYETALTVTLPLKDKIAGITVNPVTGKGLAVSSESKTLYVIDAPSGTNLQKIPLTQIPAGVAVDTKRNIGLVFSTDGAVYFIDLDKGTTLHSTSTGKSSYAIAVDQSSDTAILAVDGGLLIIDLASGNTLHEISLPSRVSKIVANDGKAIVVGSSGSTGQSDKKSNLQIIEGSTGTVIRQAIINDEITGIDVDNGLGIVLLGLKNKGSVVTYDLNLQPLSEINICSSKPEACQPSAISVNPSTHVAVVIDTQGGNIVGIDLEKKVTVQTIREYPEPSLIAVDPSWNIIFATYKEGIALVQLDNPLPKIDFLIPQTVKSGSDGFSLSIEGSKFLRTSQAQFNRKNVTTYFKTNEKLQVDIDTSDLIVPGYIPVTVTNPLPGGGTSNALTFTIYNLAPVLDSLSPDVVAVNAAFTLRVSGKNFFNGSVINLNGANLRTRFISSIMLEAEVSKEQIANTGTYSVVVVNPQSESFTSNPAYLKVVEPDDPLLQSAKNNQEGVTGTGSLKGKIVNTHLQPVAGVKIKVKSLVTETDDNGNFTLGNVPAGKRVLLIDGSQAKEKDGHYPTIPITVDIQAGVVNNMPFQVYLHRQKNKNFKHINSSEDTVLTDTEVPGFEMRIPKGVRIIGWDGQPNLKVSVRKVPIDRLPVKPLPENAHVRTVHMFYFNKVGGGTPDQPIPIKSLNDLGLLPGEKAVLWYYDESPNEGEAPNDWAIAGTGTVTSDGQYIVSDPGVGIPKFCCGAMAWGGTGSGAEKTGPEKCRGQSGDPVDLATGYFIHAKTDLYVPGIIPVSITRYYRSGDASIGAFGRGTSIEYDLWLGDYGDMLLLIEPGNYQYQFAKQPDGTYTNTTDPDFAGAVVTYNASDDTRTLRLRDGLKYTFAYKDRMSGELIGIEDRNGNKLSFTRRPRPASGDDQGGYLMEIITAEGKKITFNQTYTAPFFRTDSILDPAGRVVTYTYEDDPFSYYPRLKMVAYTDGTSVQYQYDASGRLSGVINERGIIEVSNEYDANNRVIKQTHTDGGIYTFSYTLAGGYVTETRMTAPNSAATTWRFYDDTGAYRDKYITNTTTPDGMITYEREMGTNLLKSITDPLGRKNSYTYYADGSIKTITDNLGNTTTYEYEPTYGMPKKVTDALGNISTMAYDAKGNVTGITTPDGKTTTVGYNTIGRPTSVTDVMGNTATLEYDTSGNLLKIIDPLRNSSKLTYDSLANPLTITDAKGVSTSYIYDVMGRMLSSTDPLGNTTKNSYGIDGRLTMVTDAKNHTIKYEYDDRSRAVKMTDQMNRAETYAYDTSDNLLSLTDRKGQTTTYIYDQMNRLTKATYADGSYTDYSYDAAGRLIAAADSLSGAISYTYNDYGCSTCSGRGMDRIAQETTPHGSVSYTYDALGRRTSMTVAGQSAVNYAYDVNSRLTNINTLINGVTSNFNISHDDLGRRTSLVLPNGVTTNYSYDIANRLLSLQHKDPLNTVLESLGYTHDANGNIVSMSRPGVNLPFPNPVTNTSHDEANQMFTFNDKTITYDDNGNMTSVTNTCGTTNYTWDVRNRLIGISGFAPDCSALTASSKYDAWGRRIEKTINGKATQYLYDRYDIVQEIESGAVSANYIRTGNIDEPLVRIKSDGSVRYYQTDALGSIIVLTDETGAVRTTYAYDPFGSVSVSGEASDNPFQYTGRENDGTGLYYYRARYYNPELQRFISEDPIGLAGGDINFHAYVGNNPISLIDPFGLDWVDDLANFSAGMGDTISSGFGLTSLWGWDQGLTGWVRQQLGSDNVVNKCSGWYKGGKWAGYAWGAAFGSAWAARSGITVFAHGGRSWHAGLELTGNLNLIHIGNHVQHGVHLAIGYVGPMAAWLHIYVYPQFRLWWPR